MSDALRLYVYRGASRVGLVESAGSLQWMPAFDGPGEIKLVCGATALNRAMLVQGAVLYNPDTPGLAAEILATDLETAEYKLTVRGKFTLQRFAQRVAKGKTTVTDAAAGLLGICRANLRGLPVTVPDTAPFAAACEAVDVAWTDCLTAMQTLAKAGGFGMRCVFDPATGGETLELVQGKDRSAPGSELYMGYFSTRMQNLSAPTYTQDVSDYANVVLCGGEEPGEDDSFTRYFCEIGDTTSTGNARHELWVDGSSVRHKYTDASGTERTYTEAEYQTAVQNYARAALVNHLGTRQLKCTAADSQMIYGRDYALGDIVPIRVEEIGLEASARVASLKIIYENTGRTLCPVFDNFTFKKE
mgnify:CR=1 FL=1